MSQFSGSFITVGAGSSTLPIGSIYAAAATRAIVREITVINTTAVAFLAVIKRLTTAGTAAAQTELEWDPDGAPPLCTLVDTHTVLPTLAAGEIARASIQASIGAGFVFKFGGRGLIVPIGVANGIGVIPLTGTGQIADITFGWEE